MENVQKRENYNQVCVIHGLLVSDDEVKDFEEKIQEVFETRIQFLETIKTNPDLDNDGKPVKETGGRHDVFFAAHDDDVGKFAVPRLMNGIRWIEDVLAECNYKSPIYPKRVFDYCTWNKEYLSHWKDE
jgi:hypothetical protein